MKFAVEIPDFLKHLPVDERGFPIPYFVAYVKGKPDFRLLDAEKRDACVKYKKCMICAGKLVKGKYYFISGPHGASNRVSTDPAMHKECALFSLEACPHMYFERADRRASGMPDEATGIHGQVLKKPTALFLIEAKHYEIKKVPGQNYLIKYDLVRFGVYGYKDGVITELHAGDTAIL